ncbi:hypothetical protein [Desulfovibrio cuneatus]|uniref:hypothetical protein n=1 Tax=Desulfovibrio cuneatus TaxID=159728 RepID=UPI000414EB05|nr:hypothetical protein [Desulfovibrio cuneatus]
MIALYVMLLLVSTTIFYAIRGIISNTKVRFAIAAGLFLVLATLATGMLIRGHMPPPGAKAVDMEEMKRKYHELGNGTP